MIRLSGDFEIKSIDLVSVTQVLRRKFGYTIAKVVDPSMRIYVLRAITLAYDLSEDIYYATEY